MFIWELKDDLGQLIVKISFATYVKSTLLPHLREYTAILLFTSRKNVKTSQIIGYIKKLKEIIFSNSYRNVVRLF